MELTYLLKHLTPDNALMVVITIALFKVYNRFMNISTRLDLNEKKVKKLVQVMEQCPSTTKEIVAWLGDDRKNSKPPTPSRCEIPCTKDLKK